MRTGVVSGADVHCVAVGVGVDGDGGGADLLAGGHHAHGDLAPVGDQDALERWLRLLIRGSPACRALLQEGADALLAFVTDAKAGDRVRR